MNGWSTILRAWDPEPSVLAGCVALLLADLALSRWDVRRLAGRYALGVTVLALSLVSPLDVLSDQYLFAAHMLQHLLLVLIVPPLIISGLPREPLRRALRRRPVARIEAALSRLPLSWFIGIGTLAVWHLPALYNAALADEDIHVVEHLCFLVSATIFWWPIFTPLRERRPGLVAALVYVMTGAYANAVVGLVLFSVPLVLYPAYLRPEDSLHILALVRGAWGMTPAEDQKVGGLLMTLGGSFPFAAAEAWVLWTHRAARGSSRSRPLPRGGVSPGARDHALDSI